METSLTGAPDDFSIGGRYPYADSLLSSPNGGTLHGVYSVPKKATASLIIALTHDLPGDAPGQQHIVLGMDPHAASLAENIAWGTLFRNTLEDTLIAAMQNYINPDPTIVQDALNKIVNYAFTDATTGILDGLAQPNTAFFDPNAGVFTIESWSDGTILGTGTVTAIAVPEPVGLGVLSLGCVALLRRRRTV